MTLYNTTRRSKLYQLVLPVDKWLPRYWFFSLQNLQFYISLFVSSSLFGNPPPYRPTLCRTTPYRPTPCRICMESYIPEKTTIYRPNIFSSPLCIWSYFSMIPTICRLVLCCSYAYEGTHKPLLACLGNKENSFL